MSRDARRGSVLARGLAAAFVLSSSVAFGEPVVIVPQGTIYPGDAIEDGMLRDEAWSGEATGLVTRRTEILGKVSRRTLLAGRAIALSSLEDPQTIRNGASVKLVYETPEMTITATGQALQSARTGDAIRARNVESGLVVSGIVTGRGVIQVDR